MEKGRIRERLDRAVCNQRWNDLFPLAAVIHEDFSRSDHRPIVVDLQYLSSATVAQPSGKKRFEARWLMEESVDSVVE